MEHPFKKIGSGIGNFNLIRNNLNNDFEKFENFRNWGNFTVSISPKKTIDEKNTKFSYFLTLHDRDNDTLKNNIKDLLLCSSKSFK